MGEKETEYKQRREGEKWPEFQNKWEKKVSSQFPQGFYSKGVKERKQQEGKRMEEEKKPDLEKSFLLDDILLDDILLDKEAEKKSRLASLKRRIFTKGKKSEKESVLPLLMEKESVLPSLMEKEVKEKIQQELSEYNFQESEVRNEETSILDGAMKMKLKSPNSTIQIRARLATDQDFNKISEYVRSKRMVRTFIPKVSNEPSIFRNLLGLSLNLNFMRPVNFLQGV